MSDLFHEDVPDEWIDQIFAVMALSPQHTFQVLTKRAKRMREYVAAARQRIIKRARDGNPSIEVHTATTYKSSTKLGSDWQWPLPNVWLGVSTERQKEADERIPELLATPAAVRFISAEPLLGPIDLTAIKRTHAEGYMRPLDGRFRTLDWVIVGGESGPGSRPMHPDWARALRDQCLAAGVPFFFKQWGSWVSIIDRDKDGWDKAPLRSDRDPDKYRIHNFAGGQGFHGERVQLMQRTSKAQAGRELDGLLHDEMPAAFEGRRGIVDQLEGTAP